MDEYTKRCRNKAGRQHMAREISILAEEHGVAWHIGVSALDDAHSLSMILSRGPYCVNLSFNGRSRVGAFLGHWYTDHKSDARYPDIFGFAICGSVNPYHRRKATTCAQTFEALKQSLRDGFECLRAAA